MDKQRRSDLEEGEEEDDDDDENKNKRKLVSYENFNFFQFVKF